MEFEKDRVRVPSRQMWNDNNNIIIKKEKKKVV